MQSFKQLCCVGSILIGVVEAKAEPTEYASAIVNSAVTQIGLTVSYDPSYQSLSYPNGDIDRTTGVCSDVVIRALRDAHGLDLQSLLHDDMKSNFASYPQNWGLMRPDKNIDHRRVPNLRRYFERLGADVGATKNPLDYQAGDIVSWRLPGNLTHIGIVSENRQSDGVPLIIHNIGAGAKEENILFSFEITGHFRLSADQL